MDEQPATVGISRNRSPPLQALNRIRRHCLSGLYLHREDAFAQVNQGVYLVAGCVPPEKEGGVTAAIGKTFYDLRYHV